MDYVGGFHGAFAVLEAILRRNVDGKGRHIDLAQFEGGVGTLGGLLVSAIVNGASAPRYGNCSTEAAPQGCYPCAGEELWCVISVVENAVWRALSVALGDPAWARDLRFETLADGLSTTTRSMNTSLPGHGRSARQKVERRLKAEGVAAERVREAGEVIKDEPGSVFHLKLGGTAPVLLSGLPFAFIPRDKQSFGDAPRLGEHTDEALKEWLAMSEFAIADLRGRAC